MSTSSRRWLREHFTDPYVKRAQKEGYPSRAAYKLLELNQKDHFFRKNMTVVDLGATPGGWSMVAREQTGSHSRILALDILPMDPIAGVEFIQGDFTEEAVYENFLSKLNGAKVDLVLSDMSPNISGMKSVDQPKGMYLVELAWQFAEQVLTKNGIFIVKIFQGEGVDAFVKILRPQFETVKWRKPDASRSRSREMYLVALGYRGA